MAVLAVVMTAPLGALATSLLGPVLLKKKKTEELDDQSQPPEANSEAEEKFGDTPIDVVMNGGSRSGIGEGRYVCECHACGIGNGGQAVTHYTKFRPVIISCT